MGRRAHELTITKTETKKQTQVLTKLGRLGPSRAKQPFPLQWFLKARMIINIPHKDLECPGKIQSKTVKRELLHKVKK